MKIIYLILIIFISFNLSNQTEELSEKGVNMLKCFFLTKERIDIMYSFFEKLFMSEIDKLYLIFNNFYLKSININFI